VCWHRHPTRALLTKLRAALRDYADHNPLHMLNTFDAGRQIPERYGYVTLSLAPDEDTVCERYTMFVDLVENAGGLRFRDEMSSETLDFNAT
jgi:hypothetical protein